MRLLSRCVGPLRVWPRRSMWPLLHSVHRLASSSASSANEAQDTSPPSSAAAVGTSKLPGQTSAVASLQTLFHGRPLSERLAALLLARQLCHVHAGTKTAQGTDRIPLYIFASQLHPITRRAVTASKLTLAQWVQQSVLLELVGPEHVVQQDAPREGGTWAAQHDMTSSSSSVVQVRLRCCDPHTLLATCEDTDNNTKNNTVDADKEALTSDALPLQQPGHTLNSLVDLLTYVLQRVAAKAGERYVDLGKLVLLAQRTTRRCECSAAALRDVEALSIASTTSDAKAHLTSYLQQHHAEERFWLVEETLNKLVFVALRERDEGAAPLLAPPLAPSPLIHVAPSAANHFCGWGSSGSVPTRADVYEILKYVPVNWGNLGRLDIPAAVRRRHIRCSSMLMWLRRQPCYFEVRDMKGTLEVRRAAWLHAAAHGLSMDEARAALLRGLREGQLNTLLPPPAPQAAPAAASATTSTAISSSTPKDAGTAHNSDITSSTPPPPAPVRDHGEELTLKFLVRACPSYFVPLSLVMHRAPNKVITEAILLDFARANPTLFEVVAVRYSDIPLVRRRTGVDSARWRDAFLADLTSEPGDVRAILTLCGHLCPLWDRPEYLYLLLRPDEQRIVGGYEQLLPLMRRHPAVFRVGRTFVARVHSADPIAQQTREPGAQEAVSRSMTRDENPYIDQDELIRVLHYIAPRNAACSPALLVQNASPAMRIVLPIRLITVLQLYPHLFACTETSPGVFVVRRLEPKRAHDAPGSHGAADAKKDSTTSAAEEKRAIEDDDSWLSDEDAVPGEPFHTRADLVAALKALVPASGVESGQLLLWASMSVQRAVTKYYGGLANMLAAEPTHFRVVEEDGRGKVVYLV